MTHIDPGSDALAHDQDQPPAQNGADRPAADAATEAFARRLGWRPEGEFANAPASKRPREYLTPDQYIAKVENEVPIMRDRLRRQDQNIVGLTGKLDDTARKVDEATSVIKAMHENQKTIREREYKRARADIEREMDEAARVGDSATYDSRKAAIVALDTEHREAAPAPAAKPNGQAQDPPFAAPPAPPSIPEVDAWADANPWFRRSVVLNQAAIEHEAKLPRTTPLAERLEQTAEWVQENFADTYPEHFPDLRPADPPPPPPPPAPPAPASNQRRREPARVTQPAGGAQPQADGLTYEKLTAEERQHCDYMIRTIPQFTKEDFLKDYTR